MKVMEEFGKRNLLEVYLTGLLKCFETISFF